MSRKILQSSVENPLESDQVDRSASASSGGRQKVEAEHRNGETASSSPESGSLNGDGKRSGKSRRRKKRSSNPENQAEGKAEGKNEEKRMRRAAEQAAALIGLQSECAHIWFERGIYERAESRYQCWLLSPKSSSGSASAASPSVPNFLEIPSANRAVQSRTPDEGYRSLTPTPATPGARQTVNGLPFVAAELLRDVWLEKPQYDRAEAAFYQNLYGNNSSKRPGRTAEHPQSLKEEEEEEEEEVAVVEKRVVLPGKAEVFHALHPIQEEEEPLEMPDGEETSGTSFFLHPDSERVWMDKWRYDVAESRFYGNAAAKACVVKKDRRREADKNSRREKKMSSVDFLSEEKIWFDKPRFDEAERRFYERMNGSTQNAQDAGANSILQDIARARENIQKSLAGLKSTLCNRESSRPLLNPSNNGNNAGDQGEVMSRIRNLEQENQSLHQVVEGLRAALSKLESRVAVLEKTPAAVVPVVCTNGTSVQKNSAPVKNHEEEDDDDDDMDLFGSDEDEEADKLKEQRLKEYAERKAKKPAIIAKSSILLDVKPWDDETDMAKLEECVRSVQADGLLWGTSKLVPVGYGIKKLQIACVVEDDKVGTDLLEEEITKFEDYVQSVDVAAFNKI